MEFYIKKNATLPLLKLQVVKNGRADYNKFMDMLEQSAMFFSMVDTETGIAKISSRPAGFVEKTKSDPNAETEYYLYYQFQNRDTNKVGRYEAQFMLRNSEGVLILPIREKLYVNVQESFIADDLPYDSCYVSEFPCCVNGPYTTTTTTTPCPTCPTCPPPITTTTTTIFPQPSPTPTPVDLIIKPIITENDEYIVAGQDEYLMYVDPEIEYVISTQVTSGSVETTFTVTSNFGINYNVTIPLTVKLGLVGGGTIDITANVIMLSNQVVGQTVVLNPSISYASLNKTGELFVGAITPQNFPTSILATQIQFQQEPTPTPTPTVTPTPSITPTITSTQTPTPTPTLTPTPTSSPLPPEFISVWQTNAPGDTITLPYSNSGTYSGTIDWGDGNTDVNSYSNRTHSYAVASAYTITITGVIQNFSFLNGGVPSKLLEIKKWGPLELGNTTNHFNNCTNLVLTGVTDTLNLTGVSTLAGTFSNCSSLTTINNLNSWNVSSITTMVAMFNGCNNFIGDVSSWDVSNVTDFDSMFFGAKNFNSNISSWVTNSATGMNSMFNDADTFNQNISGWNVCSVSGMKAMFLNAISFNQNLSSWKTPLILSEPSPFAAGSPLDSNPSFKPSWGAPC